MEGEGGVTQWPWPSLKWIDRFVNGELDIDGLHTNNPNSQIIKEDEQMEELMPSGTRTRIVRPPVHYQS